MKAVNLVDGEQVGEEGNRRSLRRSSLVSHLDTLNAWQDTFPIQNTYMMVPLNSLLRNFMDVIAEHHQIYLHS